MKKSLFIFILMILIFSACTFPGYGNSAENLELTNIAQTSDAIKTSAAMGTSISFTTQTLNPASVVTATPEIIQQTSTVTNTHTAAITKTNTALPCNWALFIDDITIEDGTEMTGATHFTKTWELKNVGTCEWNANYELVFANGDSMGGPASLKIGQSVSPGNSVQLSVDLVAPNSPGTYRGNWKLRSDSGVTFGIGSTLNEPFYVEIEVVETIAPVDPDEPLDFAASYCAAVWRSEGKSSLPCPSYEPNFDDGSVWRENEPWIEEDYHDNEVTIVVVPNDSSTGMIEGLYPAINVQAGDHFAALLGCMAEKEDCNVVFKLNYRADGGSIETLATWSETFDGNYSNVDIDLSSLAGKSVEFILRVENNGNNEDDMVFWMKPRIVR